MSFTEVLFELAQKIVNAFLDLGVFFTEPNFLARLSDRLDMMYPSGIIFDWLSDILPNIIEWLAPSIAQASFAEWLLLLGLPIIIIFSFISWVLKAIPIL